MNNDQISLHYQDGRSDKVYHVQLEASGSGYVVNFQYGRRGSTLNSGTKTAAPISYDKARKVYDALVKEKVGKGYQPIEGARSAYTPAVPDTQFTGILPQLLNAVDEKDAGDYLDDPNWVMQQKFDGRRTLVHVGGLGELIVGINRKGQAVALSQAAAAAIGALYRPNMVLDTEAIGEKLFVFDLLEHDGKDIRAWPFSRRYQQLTETLASLTAGGPVELAPVYSTSKEKRAAYESLREDGAEGVAFKRADSAYVPGRPASGGNALKVKFWQSASVLVSQVNEGKRSVAMSLLDHAGKMVNVGSVTIPQNQAIPNPGSILEVRYLYAFEGGSLFQPTSLGPRDDIARTACTLAQLVFKPADEFEEDVTPSP